jgi:hypothetical protein
MIMTTMVHFFHWCCHWGGGLGGQLEQSYRNRAASYNRWVRTFLRDVLSPTSTLDPDCICLAVSHGARA